MFFTHIFQAFNERDEQAARKQETLLKTAEESSLKARSISPQLCMPCNSPVDDLTTTRVVYSSTDPRIFPVHEIPPRATSRKPTSPRHRVTPEGSRSPNGKMNFVTAPRECITPLTMATPVLPPIGCSNNQKLQQCIGATTNRNTDAFLHPSDCWPSLSRLPPLEPTHLSEASNEKHHKNKWNTRTKGEKLDKRKRDYAIASTRNRDKIESSDLRYCENQDSIWHLQAEAEPNGAEFEPQGENSTLELLYRSRFNHSANFSTTVQLQEFEEIFLQSGEQTICHSHRSVDEPLLSTQNSKSSDTINPVSTSFRLPKYKPPNEEK